MLPPEWRADFRPSLAVPTTFQARYTEFKPDKLTPKQREVMDVAYSRLASGNIVAISGGVGQGKTTIAYLLSQRLGLRTVYLTAADLFIAWVSWLFLENKHDAAHNMRLLRTCPFLVLDDPQNARSNKTTTTPLTDTEKNCLTWVIGHRYNEKRPTLILSNHTGNQFETWAGDAVADRVLDGAFITCDWGSFRGGEK